MTAPAAHWAQANPLPAAVLAVGVCGLLVLAGWLIVRGLRAAARPSASVVVASIGAAACTGYTADTSWRFAAHRLGMHSQNERLFFFAAGEIALLACALLARAHKRATTTDTTAGTSGTPGVLVWVITGVQVIPALTESGLVGGTVRAVIGPVMAGILWHLAMGLEIRIARPQALASGLLAVVGRELRERVLSYAGLATRDRDAEQITRDRATARAVRLASRDRLGPWGKKRLAAAVARAQVGVNGQQRHQLMQLLAARRGAAALKDVPLPSLWTVEAVPAPYLRTPHGITTAELKRLDRFDAVRRVAAAHPDRTPAGLASLCTGYGVPVTETLVRMATRAGNPPRLDTATPAVPDPVEPPAPEAVPAPEVQAVPAAPPAQTPVPADVPDTEVHPEVQDPEPVLAADRTRTQVHARLPESTTHDAPAEHPDEPPAPAAEYAPVPEPSTPSTPPGTDALLDRARVLDAEHRRTHGKPAGIRALKSGLGVGQSKASAIRRHLDAQETQ
ncbi:hypothetical protein [Streptomyces qinglanensis]|uniref:Uncharacterized protein n=1 Tax=Streptomyces qinglanensis TaxID=943816 RepID=A0A1H9U2S1_9ACTN|nr:hypothetical protein [Streptomyces qinglanensis]SES03805.1 hypothetical protein SAMN05421870_107274 [Streptomyces qinglanensis]